MAEVDQLVKRLKPVKFLGKNMDLIRMGDKKLFNEDNGNLENRAKNEEVSFEKSSGVQFRKTGVENGKRVVSSVEGNGRQATFSGTKRDLNFKADSNKDFDKTFGNSLIGFSRYPVTGVILKEVLKELGFDDIQVKEILCWKFSLYFPEEESL